MPLIDPSANTIVGNCHLNENSFNDNEAALVQIDLLYEGQFWFSETLDCFTYFALRNPYYTKAPQELFEYYKAKVTGVI